jgi:protocatechuate 3,4-dioxygenase, alpha subunit
MTVAPTPSQTVGPFFWFGLCGRPSSDLVSPGEKGAWRIFGSVFDGAREPASDAMVEIWQADEEGRYRADFGWGRCGTDNDGCFSFTTVKPGPVRGPDDALQAPHLVVLVFARGLLKPVLTRMYFPDEPEANAADPVLAAIDDAGARDTLIAAEAADGLRFDVRLQGDGQTAFFAL